MHGRAGWRSVARLAFRDLRAAPRRAAGLLALFLLAVTLLAGVSLAARAAASALRAESRAWLGGDFALTTGEPLDPASLARLHAIPGSRVTLVLLALSAASSAAAADPIPAVVQAVDPTSYPLYGRLQLDPPGALAPDALALSPELLAQLGIRVGDSIELAGVSFRAAAVIQAQSDRFSAATGLPHRVLLSHAAYERSGLARRGGQARYRFLVRLDPAADAAAARRTLESLAPEASVAGHRDAGRQSAQAVLLATSYFRAAALLALLFGAAGAALSLRRQIEMRLDAIAILRALGASRRRIAAVFALQAILLLLAALTCGIPLSLALAHGLLAAAAAHLALPAGTFGVPALDLRALGEAAAAAMLAMLPGVVLAWRAAALRPGPLGLHAAGLLPLADSELSLALAAAVLPAAALSGSWTAAAFAALLLLAGAAMSAGAAGVLVLLRRAAPALRRAPLALRHGLANLHRPAHRAPFLIAALGCGVALILTTALSAAAVTRLMVRNFPAGRADLAVVNFDAAQRDAVRGVIESLPDVLRPVEIVTQARVRLTAVNGAPPAHGDPASGDGWYISGCRDGLGAGAVVAQGVAAALGLAPGDTLAFAARDRTLVVQVAAIEAMPPLESFWYSLTLDCRGLRPESLFHQALVRVPPGAAEHVRATLQRRLPAFAVIGEPEVAAALLALGRQAFTLARAVALLAAGLGVAALCAFVFTSQTHRAREAALLAALGARPAQLRNLMAVELAAIGFLAGALGAAGAAVLTGVAVFSITGRLEFLLGWRILAAAPLLTALLTVAAGWWPLQSVLRVRPLAALRGE